MEDLLKQQCAPVKKGTEPLSQAELKDLMTRFDDWQLTEVNGVMHLQRTFKVSDFAEALALANEIGEHADEQDHHPMLVVEYGKLRVDWWTHTVNGLHQNDFIMAARVDDIWSRWDLISGAKDDVDEAVDQSFPASDPPAY